MVAGPCPCGVQTKPGLQDVQYITAGLIDLIATASGITAVLQALDPVFGRAIDIRDLCAHLPPPPPTLTALDFVDPVQAVDDLMLLVRSCAWNEWCQCVPCPPISSCTGGNSWAVTSADAICPPTNQVAPPDPCAPCQEWDYLLNDGATYYCQRSDGACFGPFTGLDIVWSCPSFDPPNGRVCVGNATGPKATCWDRATFGDQAIIYVGDGAAAAPTYIATADCTIAPAPTPDACDPTTICTAVDYLRQQVTVLTRLVNDVMDGANVLTTPSTINLPDGTALTGPISQILQPALQYLLPLLPAQLTSPVVTPVSSSTTLDVTGEDYAFLQFTAVPPWIGSRGTVAPVYWSLRDAPGPGWVIVYGPEGVLDYRNLDEPNGTLLSLPKVATHLAIELATGVEITVTTYRRSVS